MLHHELNVFGVPHGEQILEADVAPDAGGAVGELDDGHPGLTDGYHRGHLGHLAEDASTAVDLVGRSMSHVCRL